MKRKANQFSYDAIRRDEKEHSNLTKKQAKVAKYEAEKVEYPVPGIPGLWVLVHKSVENVPEYLKNYAENYKKRCKVLN